MSRTIFAAERVDDTRLQTGILSLCIGLGATVLAALFIIKSAGPESETVATLVFLVLPTLICVAALLVSPLYVRRDDIPPALVGAIAFGIYAIYLFHYEFLELFSLVVDGLTRTALVQNIVILTAGTAGTIATGYIIQRAEQRVVGV